MPQFKILLQPSEIWPQFLPASEHVFGVQDVGPHRFGPAPPHTPLLQEPQSTIPPQPSSTCPQLFEPQRTGTQPASLPGPVASLPPASWLLAAEKRALPQAANSPQPSTASKTEAGRKATRR